MHVAMMQGLPHYMEDNWGVLLGDHTVPLGALQHKAFRQGPRQAEGQLPCQKLGPGSISGPCGPSQGQGQGADRKAAQGSSRCGV